VYRSAELVAETSPLQSRTVTSTVPGACDGAVTVTLVLVQVPIGNEPATEPKNTVGAPITHPKLNPEPEIVTLVPPVPELGDTDVTTGPDAAAGPANSAPDTSSSPTVATSDRAITAKLRSIQATICAAAVARTARPAVEFRRPSSIITRSPGPSVVDCALYPLPWRTTRSRTTRITGCSAPTGLPAIAERLSHRPPTRRTDGS
jgi:hypothetical protein